MTGTELLRERAYYLLRAESELRRAREAKHEEAARAHFLIAGTYFDRVHRLLNLDEPSPATGG